MRLPFFMRSISRCRTKDEVRRLLGEYELRPIFCPRDKSHLLPADALLYRPAGLAAGIISYGAKGGYSHFAMVGGSVKRTVVEVREWQGGRISPLDGHVRRRSGRIDVFSPVDLTFPERFRAVEEMRRFDGVKYGWGNLFWAAVRHLPFARWLMPWTVNDDWLSKGPPFCSQAGAIAYRKATHGRFDPVTRRADAYTEPSDFETSPLFDYVGTLVWWPEEVRST